MCAGNKGPPPPEKSRIEPSSTALLDDPLDFFFAEHFRQRELCNLLEEMARADRLDRRLAAEVIAFLRHDLVLHIQDEEEDLYPMMRRRCPPEDEIERVFTALTAEHAGGRVLAERMNTGLEAALREGRAGAAQSGLREAMLEFARSERRHLALENAVVLPLARRRLTPKDLEAMAVRMRARRAQEPAREGA
ncbi:hemerythrin domain-containing protein [Pelagibius marinus]|uniref:hemerythrin domain-containing protein n=1 Tax=Pelagibius marinus TaxID=2762760 RepID=UPI0018722B35|nr:hemerythrin domain-containing protein [Pelagibius marinus]